MILSFASVIQVILNNAYLAGSLVLTTLGITLTQKTANVTNFAQAIISTFGAFTASYFYMTLGWNSWVALVAGVVTCFVFGLGIDMVILRRATKVSSVSRLLITIALIMLTQALIPMFFGIIPYTWPRFLTGRIEWTTFGTQFTITKNGLFSLLLSLGVTALIFILLRVTKWGLGVRSTASDKEVASLLGVNTNRIMTLSWAISSACGGLSAILYASQTTDFTINLMGLIQINSLLAFVLGGSASFYGPIVSAVFIIIIRSVVQNFAGIWAGVGLYAVILLLIMIRPNGLFGRKSAKKV